jgi:hypothetical protein
VREEEVVCSYMSQIKKDHEHAYSQVFVVCVFVWSYQKKFFFISVLFKNGRRRRRRRSDIVL